jgi:hypothetical protein
MQLTYAVMRLESAIEAHLRLADPEIAAFGPDLLEVLRPTIRQTLMDITQMAAEEISGQLATQAVEIRLSDGEPELRVVDDERAAPDRPLSPGDLPDAEARITLRLPEQLKDLISNAAEEAGDSVNTFVVEALRASAGARRPSGRVRKTIDL